MVIRILTPPPARSLNIWRKVSWTWAACALLFLCASALAAQWCARPIGAATRDAAWASIQPLLANAETLAGKRTYVIITRPSFEEVSRQRESYENAYAQAAINQLLEIYANRRAELGELISENPLPDTVDELMVARAFRRNDGKYDKPLIRALVGRAKDLAKTDGDQLAQRALSNRDDPISATLTDGDSSSTSELTYVYTNDPVARERMGVPDVERGATLESSAEDLQKAFAPGGRFSEIFSETGIVFLDRINLDQRQVLEIPARPLVRLPAMQDSSYERLATLVHGTHKRGHAVWNLLPKDAAEARVWGFDPKNSDDYAAAGRRLDRKLKKASITPLHASPTGLDLVKSIEERAAGGERPVIIGEAGPTAGTVRIPGTSEILDTAQLSSQAREAAWFIFCNSAASTDTLAGFSMVGRVWLDSVAEMVGTFGPRGDDTANSKEGLNARNDWATEIARLHGERDGRMFIPVWQAIASAPPGAPAATAPAQPSVPTPDGMPSGGSLFLLGALGGVAFELFRWRRISAKYGKAPFQSAYFYLWSVAFVLIAGVVGYLFGPVVTSPVWQRIVAFVAGCGLEELVKRAARLEIWSPNVALGVGAEETGVPGPATLEFLRA